MVERELMSFTTRTPLLRCCSLIAFLLAVASPALASKDAVPDWVHAAIAQPLGKYPAETTAVILLDETTLTVDQDGKAIEHHRHVVKILRPSGREEGIVHVAFDKDTKILSLHVWSVGPDGHEYAVKDSDMSEVGLPGQGSLYEDIKFKIAEPPGRDPGGVIAYEFDQRREPYMHENTWFFQDDIPRVTQNFTLILPPGYTYGTVWAHHDPVKAIDLEHQRYRWDFNATPGIAIEEVPMRPSLSALAPRMTVHYSAASGADDLATWKGIGQWFDGISHDRLQPSPELAAKAAELTAGKTDFYDKAEAIGEFVQQQIRYFVVEMGIGGYQPHAAADIFHNRYGDCKDKATLLSAMLSSVGIHSAIVLVDTRRGVVDPEAPSLVGNHAIGAIEIPTGYQSAKLRSVVSLKSGKRYLIFDPTWDKTAFGQLEANLQGGSGLIVEGKNSEVVQFPLLNPALNSITRTASFDLETDGSLKGAIVEKRFGDLSEHRRDLFATTDLKQQHLEMDRTLRRDFAAFEISDLKVENVASLNKDLTTSFSISAQRYGRNAGALIMVRPRVMGSEGPRIDRKERSVPIDLGETMTAQDDFTIHLPEGYALDELPEPIKLDVGFASYESASKLDGNVLHYTRTYTVRQVSLPADRYPDVQKLAAAIDADEQNHAVFKKK